MKNIKWLIIFIYLSTLTLSSCAVSTENIIIGKWKAVDSRGEQEFFFVFDKFGYAKMIKGEEVIGGRDSEGISMKYKTDYSSDPNTLVLFLCDGNGQVLRREAMIIKFISPDEIKIGGFGDDIRPERFDLLDKEDMGVLIRVKEVP